jgi:hypothetical protein
MELVGSSLTSLLSRRFDFFFDFFFFLVFLRFLLFFLDS